MPLRGTPQDLADLLLHVLVREVEKKARCDASFAPLGAHQRSVPAFCGCVMQLAVADASATYSERGCDDAARKDLLDLWAIR